VQDSHAWFLARPISFHYQIPPSKEPNKFILCLRICWRSHWHQSNQLRSWFPKKPSRYSHISAFLYPSSFSKKMNTIFRQGIILTFLSHSSPCLNWLPFQQSSTVSWFFQHVFQVPVTCFDGIAAKIWFYRVSPQNQFQFLALNYGVSY